MSNLRFTSLTLGDLQTNCYLLWDDASGEAVIVDPADNGDFIIQKVLELQITPKAVWLTHGHFDHVLGLLEVVTAFDIPTWLHDDDSFLLADAAKSAQHWLGRTVDPVPPANLFWRDGDQVSLGEHTFEILHAPGHTPGSVGLYSAENDLLLSGDTLFKGTIGRTDFSYSDPGQMRESLEKLFELPLSTLVLPGHGETTTIRSEKR